MSAVQRTRITWVDYAKGVGIVLVVFGHALRGLHTSHIIADSATFQFVDSWIYTFHMPLFFLLSGLFAERRVNLGPGSFIAEKLATLAYPYLVWSTLQTLMQIGLGRYTNSTKNLSELATILYEPIMQFWFLYALLLISLIYYGLRRCRISPLGVGSIFALFWSSQFWTPAISWLPLSATRNHGIYYALGSLIDRHGITARIESTRTLSLALIVLFGFGILTAGVWEYREPMVLLGLAMTLLGISASVALAVLLSRSFGFDFVRVLGTYSLEIYLGHTIFSAGLRIVFQKFLMVQNPAAHLLIGTVGGLVLPLALGIFCRRYHAEWVFRFPQPKSPNPQGRIPFISSIRSRYQKTSTISGTSTTNDVVNHGER